MLNNQTLQNQPPGDGGQTPTSQQGEPPGTGQTPQPTQTTPSSQQNQQGQQQQATPIEDLPLYWQTHIHDLREENRKANKKAQAEAQAKQQAEEARLKEQGEWKSLAERHEARVKELEVIDERLKAIAIEVNKSIDADIKDWPKSVKAMDPGPNVPIDQRMAWRNSMQAVVADIQNTARAQAPGNPPHPRSISGQNANDQNIEELRRRYQSQRGNPF